LTSGFADFAQTDTTKTIACFCCCAVDVDTFKALSTATLLYFCLPRNCVFLIVRNSNCAILPEFTATSEAIFTNPVCTSEAYVQSRRSLSLSVRDLTSESIDLVTSFIDEQVHRQNIWVRFLGYVKVIGSRSVSHRQKACLYVCVLLAGDLLSINSLRKFCASVAKDYLLTFGTINFM